MTIGSPMSNLLKQIITTLFFIINALGFRRVLNLPDEFWIWSIFGSAIVNLGSGAVLGWIAQKVAPVGSE